MIMIMLILHGIGDETPSNHGIATRLVMTLHGMATGLVHGMATGLVMTLHGMATGLVMTLHGMATSLAIIGSYSKSGWQ